MDPCLCREGLVVHVLSYSELALFGRFTFECCGRNGGNSGSHGCALPERHQQHIQSVRSLAIIVMILGIFGILFTTRSLNLPSAEELFCNFIVVKPQGATK